MEAAAGSQKRRLQEFAGVSVSSVSCSSSDATSPSTATLRFTSDESGSPQLQLRRDASVGFVVCVDVRSSQLFGLGPGESLCVSERTRNTKEKENSCSSAITLRFRSDTERKAFHCAFEEWKNGVANSGTSALSIKLLSCYVIIYVFGFHLMFFFPLSCTFCIGPVQYCVNEIMFELKLSHPFST
ncbi:hypothetical protein Taro_023005 [Colocasia esculenta]|uniref:Probable histone-arginine methyltransferase CARM1-like N-terminal PH domain-containing protein n=1 Tax=Colocasia esculenta TaxID=4460 RepID=A0A843V9J5_COLES|nr:hypothetical protein [Colocasia esculenta]